MIEAFRRLGEEILKEYNDLPEIERKKAVLDCLTLPIRETYTKKIKNKDTKKEEYSQEPTQSIIFNLDLTKNNIEISFTPQLSKELRGEYFVFNAPGNSKKFSFATPTLKNLIEKSIPDTLTYLEELNFKSEFIKFKEFIMTLKERFYSNDSLDFTKVVDIGALSIEDYLIQKSGFSKKEFKDRFKIFFLYINGKSILNSEFRDNYIELRYYEMVEKYFDINFKEKKVVKKQKISSLSGLNQRVTNEVSILTKFYITDKAKSVFFENCDTKNCYKAFTLSQSEFEQVLVGINFIWVNFRKRYRDLEYLIIPKSEYIIKNFNDCAPIIIEEMNLFLRNKYVPFEEERKLYSYSQENLIFDLLFYEKGQNDFKIMKLFSNMDFKNITKIELVLFDVANKNKTFFKYFSRANVISLNTIWNSLYSQLIENSGKDKVKIYRTEFFSLLDSIFNTRKVIFNTYIKKYLLNLKSKYLNRDKNSSKGLDIVLIIDSFNALQFFTKYNLVTFKKMEKEKQLLIKEVPLARLQEFFTLHKNIFGLDIENGVEKQGLVILGYLVNQIVYAQKDKSKTFLDKINFDGIRTEKIPKFRNEIIEFLGFNDILKFNQKIIACCDERLLDLSNSNLTPEEITYYILLGNFLGAYLGIEAGTQNSEVSDSNNELKEEEQTNEDEE